MYSRLSSINRITCHFLLYVLTGMQMRKCYFQRQFSIFLLVFKHFNYHLFLYSIFCLQVLLMYLNDLHLIHNFGGLQISCFQFITCPLFLLQGMEMYGLANWAEVAEHVGTKSKLQCIDHYNTIYINSPCFPLPVSDPRNTVQHYIKGFNMKS